MRPEAMDAEAALDRDVDPVARASEYQQMLLGVLGDRDPVQVQAQLPDELEAVIAEAGEHLRTRPAPGEWSALEILGHLVDAEIVLAGRYRWVLAHDEPPLVGYDQDLWVDRLRHQDDDPAEMLALLRALIRSHLRLWAKSSESERARVGIHAERGPESFDLSFRMLAGHGLFHLAQIRRTLAQAAGS
jgi:DinB family protein